MAHFHKHDHDSSKRIPHFYKYIDELAIAATDYVGQILTNVFDGFLVWHGVKDPEQYHKPLRKAAFSAEIQKLGKKIQTAIGRKYLNPRAVFRPTGKPLLKKDGKPFTLEEWRKFERDLIAYVRPYLQNAGDEMAVKSILLALMTSDAERRNKINGTRRRPLAQVERDAFAGYIPDSMREAKERFRINSDIEAAYAHAALDAAQHVQNVEDSVREAIRKQVVYAQQERLSPAEMASNMYHAVQRSPSLKGSNLSAIQRDWRRVAHTETAYYHEMGRAAANEQDARKGPVYVVLHGPGTCPWCRDHLGDIARQIPQSEIGNPADDSLSSRKIQDPFTDVAYWPGKNNVGFPQSQWRLTAPAHPWCVSDDTRVATQDGFKLFKDVKGSDMIVSLNPTTGCMEYSAIVKRISYYRDHEPMVDISSHYVNQLVTPDHRLWLAADGGPAQFYEAEQLIEAQWQTKWWMSHAAKWAGEEPCPEVVALLDSSVMERVQILTGRDVRYVRYYSGMVYCLELVKNHIMLIEREGIISWTGNCQDSMVRFYPDFQVYDKKARLIKLKTETGEMPEFKPALEPIETLEAERVRQETQAAADRAHNEHKRPTDYAESGAQHVGRDSEGRPVVDLRGQRYVAVQTDKEADALEARHEIDPSTPLPVLVGTPTYRRLFEVE